MHVSARDSPAKRDHNGPMGISSDLGQNSLRSGKLSGHKVTGGRLKVPQSQAGLVESADSVGSPTIIISGIVISGVDG